MAILVDVDLQVGLRCECVLIDDWNRLVFVCTGERVKDGVEISWSKEKAGFLPGGRCRSTTKEDEYAKA